MDSTPQRPADPRSSRSDAGVVVTRSEERLVVATRTVPVSRLQVRGRIVTEQRTVQVTVRREDLVREQSPAGPELADMPTRPAAGLPAPIVIVLHEQVPRVVLDTQPCERVSVTVVDVAGEQHVQAAVRKEAVEVDLQQPGQPG